MEKPPFEMMSQEIKSALNKKLNLAEDMEERGASLRTVSTVAELDSEIKSIIEKYRGQIM